MRPTRLWILLGATALLVGCGGASPDANAKKDTKATGVSDSVVVARVGDDTITLDEVDEAVKAGNMSVFQALYDARRQAIDAILADRLVDAEAAARGISRTDLINQEINQKSPEVTDADVETFYNQNKSRMGGRTLEQMKGQIRNYLVSQNVAKAQDAFFKQLKEKSGVVVLLDPPRVDLVVANNEPMRGPADAPVTIVEYSDFQ